MNASEWVRRHPWVFGLALALVVCSLADGWLWWRVRALRVRSDWLAGRVTMLTEAAEELRALKGRAGSDLRLLSPGMRLTLEAVNQAAKQANVAGRVSGSRATLVRQSDRVQEQVITVKLAGVSRKDLSEFLRVVEQIDPAVRTKELGIAAGAAKAGPSDSLDVEVEVAAYETVPPAK